MKKYRQSLIWVREATTDATNSLLNADQGLSGVKDQGSSGWQGAAAPTEQETRWMTRSEWHLNEI